MTLCYVTGATGCLGRNLVNQLSGENWDVVVLHRKSSDLSRLEGCKVRYQVVDLHHEDSVRAAVANEADAIFHVAANTSHWSADEAVQWKDNVLATRNLVNVALEKGVKRFIFTSSGSTRFFQETDRLNAEKLEPSYVRTKRLAELEVYAAVERGLDAVLLLPIIIVGAFDYNSYGQIFSELRSRRLKLSFPGKISFCHAADVAKAHVTAFHKGRSGERYVLGGTYTTWLEFFRQAADVMGVKGDIHVVPSTLLYVMAYCTVLANFVLSKRLPITPQLVRLVRHEPDITIYDRKKARDHLDYESRPLNVMINDCYNWLVAERRL